VTKHSETSREKLQMQ